MEHKLIKCPPDDQHRCQAGDRVRGQCPFLAESVTNEYGDVTWVKYCCKHAGGSQLAGLEKKKFHDYLLGKWQQRVDDFSSSERITNLHGEIGIIRMQIELIHEKCEDAADLMLYSVKIQDLIMKADKLVNSIDKISNRSGNLLNKSAALTLAGSIIDIIAAEVTEPERIERISDGILALVAKMAGKSVSEGEE